MQMTFSIVARESNETRECIRFGVAVTTNNPGIGLYAPFVSEHGVVATHYRTYGEVGPRILDRIDDGSPASAAISKVLEDVNHAPVLQVHGLCEATIGTHHGQGMVEKHGEGMVYGTVDGPDYSVTGNTLENFETLNAIAETFSDADRDRELADRLIEALRAGDEVGGDTRTATARSAAVQVVDPEAGIANDWYNNIRVAASETPFVDIQNQHELAKSHHDTASKEWD